MSKGISLYIAILIMAILLAIVLGTSAILISQMRVIRGMENSVIAFYAAESGVERALLDRIDPVAAGLDGYSETLSNGAEYTLEIIALALPQYFQIKSMGNYKDTNRAIQVSY